MDTEEETAGTGIVDFSQESSGKGVLSKVNPRLDGSVETLTFDIDINWSVDDTVSSLPAMLAMFPDAEDKLARSRAKKGSYSSTYKPADANVRLSLLGLEKSAAVRQVVLRTTPKSATVTARLRVFNVQPETEGGKLLGGFGKVVELRTKLDQQSMDFRQPDTGVGDIVAAKTESGEDIFGRVTRERDGGGYVVADFGVVHSHVAEDTIVSTHRLEFTGSSSEEWEQEFRLAAEAAGKTPSWRHVLAALATMLGDGKVDKAPDGTWMVNQDVMVSALDQAGVLPAEAGEAASG